MTQDAVLSERELAEFLSIRLGVPVKAEEVDEFLHQEIPYKDRFAMHDVLNCEKCRQEGAMN